MLSNKKTSTQVIYLMLKQTFVLSFLHFFEAVCLAGVAREGRGGTTRASEAYFGRDVVFRYESG